MANLDVYKNPDGPGYLLDIQADLLNHLNVRVVVPLLPQEMSPQPARRLNPIYSICSQDCVMLTQFISSVPANILETRVASLSDYHSEILDAIDMLLSGF